MKRGPLDFYHQHLWKFTDSQKPEPSTWYGCTRCGELIQSYEEVMDHCQEQECENQEVEWLKNLKP